MTNPSPPPGEGSTSGHSTDSAIRKGIAFSAESTVDGLLERTLEEACLLTSAERGALYVREGTALRFAHARTEAGGPIQPLGATLKVGATSAAGWVVATGLSVVLNDVAAPPDPPFPFDISQQDPPGSPVRSLLAVPMRDAFERVNGVIQLVNSRLGTAFHGAGLDPGMVRRVELLAAQAGTALENARLVDVLRSTVTALEHSRDKQKKERELAVHRLERITVLRKREEEILAMLRHNLLTARASIFAETDSARSALKEIDAGLERCAERLRRAESHIGAEGPAVEEFRSVARELGRIDEAFGLFRGSLGGLEGTSARIEAIARGLVALGSVFTVREPRRPVAIDAILQAMKATYSVVAPKVEIAVELAPGIVFRGDDIHYEFILENLLSNAVEQARGNPEAAGRIRIRSGRSPFHVFLQICDSGAGTDRTLEDLAQPLTSGSRAGGHGLGLWIVREVAELYGGELWLAGHGELGGATFTVMFPNSS